MKPVVDGSPLSTLRPIEHRTGTPPLWISTRQWHIRQLEEVSGWLPASPQQVLHLQTQLFDVGSAQGSLWYPATSGEPLPVLLAFTLAETQDVLEETALQHPLPPPQIGEYGLIADETGQLIAYHIMDLGLEARQRWSALGEAIRSLSAPLTAWPASNDLYDQVSDEQIFLTHLHALMQRHQDATILIPAEERDDDARFALMLAMKELKTAREYHVELRLSLEKDDWQKQWQAICQTAQELAHDYLLHHQAGAKASSVPLVKEKCQPTRRRTARPALAPSKKELLLSSNMLNHEIIKSLRETAEYTSDPGRRLLEHKHSFAKNRGQIVIEIHPLQEEGFDTLLAALSTLGDGCVDTYIAVMALAIEKYGVQHLRTAFEVSPDDILAMRGKKRSNYSYTPYQRADVIRELKTLSQARVIASLPGPGRRGRKEATEIRAEGALIDLLDFRIGEYSLITGEEIWEKRSIVLGKWVTMIPELDSQTAVMLRQVLAYSGKNERYQKRLGLHLSIMFRINAKHGGLFPNAISMRALLDMAGIIPQRKHPADFKQAIEHALARLKRDEVLGDYWQVVDANNEEMTQVVDEQAYGWFDVWLDQRWQFSPPESTKQHYIRLLK